MPRNLVHATRRNKESDKWMLSALDRVEVIQQLAMKSRDVGNDFDDRFDDIMHGCIFVSPRVVEL